MTRLLLSLIVGLLFGLPTFAQRTCGTDAAEQNLMLTDPKYQQRREQIEMFTNDFVTNYNGAERAVITIPVVVHVVYNTATENVSDAQILSQIAVLNEDFRKLNTDASSVPSAFASLAADSEIEFCMATVDPNGNPTSGITRTSTTTTSFGTNDEVKSTTTGGANAWPSDQYLNLWVCDITGGILGYAQFPGGAASTDGVVIDYLYFGTIGTATAPFNKGRTATHEVGHWLNLRHIWGDDGTGCTGSDFVADTPNAGGENYGCPTFPSISCSNGPNGDMFMNYMDYTDDACMYMFTLGQKTRMQALFAPGGVREALGNSSACGDPNTICNTPIALTESNISDTGADLSWAAVNGVAEYNLRYREFGSPTWIDVLGLTTNTYSISGLTSCTTYEWEVQTSCINTVISNYSTTQSFNTTGCPVSPYCDSYGTTTTDEWIQSVTLNTLNNNSGDNGGYAFFPSITTTLDLGQTYVFNGVTGYSADTWSESWRIWIDFNQDGDYLDAGEQVYTAANVTNSTTGNITIPATALTGPTGMRITMIYGGNAPTPCQIFTFGEVEDYIVTIAGCPPAANLTTFAINDTEATFAWDFQTGVNSYTLQYGVQGSGVWTTVTGITGNSYTATGLTSCTNYEWQLQTLCADATNSPFTASQTFITTGCLVSPYCESYGQTTVDEWIESITLNTLSNVSGDNGGYAFFPSATTSLAMGEQYTFTGTPMHSGTAYNETWSVFIDFNQDGDYLDANETVFIGGPSTTTVTGTIAIPSDALNGVTGMRVSMTYGTTPVGPCDIFQWGEVEDYIVTITGCTGLSNPTTSNVSATGADFAWDAISGGVYTLRYSQAGMGVWTQIEGLTSNTYSLTGLNSCTAYEWQVRTNCSALEFSAYTAPQTFVTTGCTTTLCVPVMNSSAEFINRVQINSIDNTSGNDGGYGDYSNMITSLQIGQTYSFAGTPGFVGTVRNEIWRAWVDWNGDGDVNDAGETLFTSGNTNTVYSTTFTVPTTASPGLKRMRVGMRRASQGAPVPCPGSHRGEEEDYTLLIYTAPSTTVLLPVASQIVTEGANDVEVVVPVELINESATAASSVEVYLMSGDGSRLVDANAQTITWSAGQGGVKYAYFQVAANNICNGSEDLVFGLQNATGGTSISIVTGTQHVLSVNDDDYDSYSQLNRDFEDATASGFAALGIPGYGATTANAISGNYSLTFNNSGSAAGTAVLFSAPAIDANLGGVETVWRYNMRTFNRALNLSGSSFVYLSGTGTGFPGLSNLNHGYALGVDVSLTSGNSNLHLFRVDNGAISAILQTSFTMNNTVDIIGVEVIRNENGVWTINIDSNGGFDNLTLVGTVTDETHLDMPIFGVANTFNASETNVFGIDDISIVQNGCVVTYYSQVPGGNYTGTVWSTSLSGAPETMQCNRFTSLVMQDGAPITLDQSIIVNNITIENNGALNPLATSDISVLGNWTVNGSGQYGPQNNFVYMIGENDQYIQGTGSAEFANLDVNGQGDLYMNIPTALRGYLFPRNGVVYTNDQLTLLSTSTRTAGISRIYPTADVIGQININRYIPSGAAGYVFIGAPTLNNPQTIENVWDDDITTTGVAGSDYPSYNFNNIYWYDETVPGGRNEGWVGMTGTADLIDTEKGYVTYQSSPALIIDTQGEFKKGTITQPLSYTDSGNSGDGWNLMVNPYPNEVNWSFVESSSSDVNSYYYYDADMPGYRAFAANLGVGSGSRYIPHSMAFFVQSTAPSQFLMFEESDKSLTNQAFERNTDEEMFIRIKIQKEGLGDEAVLAFNENATSAFENLLDAEKWESMHTTSPELAFVSSDGVLLNIDGRELPNELIQVPVYLDMPTAGTFTISFPEVQNIPFGSCISIEDTFTGEIYSVEEGTELTFDNATAGYQGNRMVVRVTPSIIVNTSNATCFNASNGGIEVNIPQGDWTYSLINEMNNVVYSGNSNESIDVSAGVYEVHVSSINAMCSSTMQNVVITEPSELIVNAVNTKAHCNLNNDAVLDVYQNNAIPCTWQINFPDGSFFRSGSGEGNHFQIQNLPAGDFVLTMVNDCEVIEIPFSTVDENAVEATMSLESLQVELLDGVAVINGSALTENATSTLWSINEEVVATTSQLNFNVDQIGTYLVTLRAANEYCGVELTQTVIVEASLQVTEENVAFSVAQFEDFIQLNTGGYGQPYEIVVTSMSGQIIERWSNKVGDFRVNTNQWAAGIYTIQAISSGVELLNTRVVTH